MKISKVTETIYKFNDKGEIIEKIVKETEYKDEEYTPVPYYPPYPIYPYSPVTYEYKSPTTKDYTITCLKKEFDKCGVGY